MNWPASRQNRQKLIAAWLIAMSISHVVLASSAVPLLRRGYQDFTIFYTAGTLVRTGNATDLYNPTVQYRVQQGFAPQADARHGALPYTHTPFEALLYAPLTILAFPLAYLLWVGINLVLLVFSLVLLRRNFHEAQTMSPLLLGLAASGFFPIAIALIQGQDTVLVLFLVVLAMVFLRKGHDALGGAVLGLALFKFHLVGPLALLVSVRRPRLLSGFVPVGLALVAVCIFVVGGQGAVDYARYLADMEKTGAQGAIVAADMANLRGLLTSTLPEGKGAALFVAIAVCSLVVLLATASRIARNVQSIFTLFACAATASILVSYHALPYDLVLLLPAGILLLSGSIRTDQRTSPRLLSLLLFLTPLHLALWLQWRIYFCLAALLLWLVWELSRSSSPPESPRLTFRDNTTPSIGK